MYTPLLINWEACQFPITQRNVFEHIPKNGIPIIPCVQYYTPENWMQLFTDFSQQLAQCMPQTAKASLRVNMHVSQCQHLLTVVSPSTACYNYSPDTT